MRLLEVVNKTDDFKKNTSRLQLLETAFTTFGKTVGDDPAMTDWENVVHSDIVSKQFMESLNADQLAFEPRYESFRADYNQWVNDSNSGWGIGLSTNENKMLIADWSSSIVVDTTHASYTEILQRYSLQERRMWETTWRYSQGSMINNQDVLKEWSKGRWYSDLLTTCTITLDYDTDLQVVVPDLDGQTVNGITMTFDGGIGGNGGWRASGMQNLPVNDKAIFNFTVELWSTTPGNDPVDEFPGSFTIARYDEVDANNAFLVEDEVATDCRMSFENRSGDSSTHFNTPSSDPQDLNLQWFQSRVLL